MSFDIPHLMESHKTHEISTSEIKRWQELWIGIYSKKNLWCLDTLGSVTKIKNPDTYPETITACGGKEMICKPHLCLPGLKAAAAIWV